MLLVASILVAVAAAGGLVSLIFRLSDKPVPPALRVAHSACGVSALVLVLAGAQAGAIAEQGLLVGLLGFATAAGGALFRQRIRNGHASIRTAVVHGGLAICALVIMALSL